MTYRLTKVVCSTSFITARGICLFESNRRVDLRDRANSRNAVEAAEVASALDDDDLIAEDILVGDRKAN